ncbi:MAG: UDP-N-acetylmuramoyl-tripeptide--D-alanyl-D-alanine ligase [Pseudomonadota bacterium]
MTALWTSDTAAAATGGRATGKWSVSGVSIDTRTLAPGDLFVALKDRRDGHEFVADALANGAAAALVSRLPEGVDPSAPLLLVDDVLTGLQDLGRAARARSDARVIGVTGSVGKTSTKEMLRTVLAAQGAVHAAEASYNNHWGVPLTLARMPPDTDFAVIEIGMNHPGEIDQLTRLAQPHVGLVTTVAAAHLEAFDDLAGIAREKASIFAGVVAGGTAICPADIDTAPILAETARGFGLSQVSFGRSGAADWRLLSVAPGPDKTTGHLATPLGPLEFHLSCTGVHFAENATAVLAAVAVLGADASRAARTLSDWRPPPGRGTRQPLVFGRGGARVEIALIDDAFNANPASVAAALGVLQATPASGRRIAVLGDMLELGDSGAALHRALADDPAMAAIDLVYCVGPLMRHLFDALPPDRRGRWEAEADTLAAALPPLLRSGDTVLVKGSKSIYVSRVVDALVKNARTDAPELSESE